MEPSKVDSEAKPESVVIDHNPKPEEAEQKSEDHASKDDVNLGSFVMGSDSVAKPQIQTENQSEKKVGEGEGSPGRSPSGTRKSVHWSPELVSESQPYDHHNMSHGQNGPNPYVARSPANPSSVTFKDAVDRVRGTLGRWGTKMGEATRKAEDLAGNTWQHLKTAPSFADAAMGRIAQSTKVFAEGGYEKIFRQTFETTPEEQLLNSYACYLSTSAGPVMGILYVSTAKLAYCSDNPLSYKNGGQTEWSYYKVLIPSDQLKAVNPSSSRVNNAEKYIQVISVDNHEFWFMGFLNYDGAVQNLQQALEGGNVESV